MARTSIRKCEGADSCSTEINLMETDISVVHQQCLSAACVMSYRTSPFMHYNPIFFHRRHCSNTVCMTCLICCPVIPAGNHPEARSYHRQHMAAFHRVMVCVVRQC